MQPVYKQLALEQQIAKQLSRLNPFSKITIKDTDYGKVEFFLYNKRKIVVKWPIHRNSAVSKALLGFKILKSLFININFES